MSVTVAGIGIHAFGRFGRTLEDLAEVAALEALLDAGVNYQDVDMTVVANVGGPMAIGQRVAARLGATGKPVLRTESACASSAAALVAASNAVRAGSVDIVLCVGVEKAPRGFIVGAGFETWQERAGIGVTPIYFGLQARELLSSTEAEAEDLALVSVKNHANAVHNPNAMYRSAVTTEDVLDSRMVCDPLTLLMLCAPNEGAAAVVLMSDKAIREHRIDRGVRLRAVSMATRRPGDWFVPAPSRLADVRSSPSRTAAAEAFAQAGLGIEDIDVVECQDTDAGSELVAYSDLGLCGAGEEATLLRSGDTQLGGRLPVNPSGGLLSKGEPLGASGLGQVHEIVTQIRGDADARQVPGARTGLAHVMGAGHVSSVTILEG